MAAPHVLLCRTDAIGDVVLALPMAGAIKRLLPGATVSFLGRGYTRPVIEACEHVDHCLDWGQVSEADEDTQAEFLRASGADHVIHVVARRDECRAARQAGIEVRIAMARRWWGMLNANRRLFFGRRRSPLHETQLNLKMLAPLGLRGVPALDEVAGLYGLTRARPLRAELAARLDPRRVNLVLHPRSNLHAPEWGLANFARLIEVLDPARFQIFLTGSPREGQEIGDALPRERANVVDLLGKLELHELVAFLGRADAVLASSTGPVHLAAAQGTLAVGLYTARPSKNAARWGPVGAHTHWLEFDPDCPACLRGEICECVSKIPVQRVAAVLERHGDDARAARLGASA